MVEDNEITLEETVVVQDRLIQKYERQIKGLEQKISSLEQENKKLTGKLDEYQATTEDKDIDNAVTLEKQTENIDRMNVKVNQLMTDVERKNGEIHQLELKNKEISESSFSKEKQIGSLEERINHLTQELDLKKQENQALQDEIKKFQAENLRISTEVAHLSGNLEGQKSKMSSDETKLSEFQTENFNLKELDRAKDTEIEELKSLNADNISKIADLEKGLKTSKDQDTQTSKTRSDLELKCKDLEAQLTKTKKILEDNVKNYKDLEQAKSTLEGITKEQKEIHLGTIKSRARILNYFKEQVSKVISKLSLTSPNIIDLKPIIEELQSISKRAQIRIATHINPEINQHIEILNQLKKMENVSIRNYPKEDRWCLERDSAEILLATTAVEPVGIILQDIDFISLVRNFIAEPFITSKIM